MCGQGRVNDSRGGAHPERGEPCNCLSAHQLTNQRIRSNEPIGEAPKALLKDIGRRARA